ncbi:MAG: helix-turn-helix transcriptional regulator [Thaumarchaeota archaeon]|nr:helix-turn-helix transcriptional regulator [Nitrososphaerota archaeon]
MQGVDSRMLPFRKSLKPMVVYLGCPVRSSLDVLGKKWTMLILYTMGFMNVNRFNQMRTYIPEVTPSVLAKRLKQLERAGYVKRISRNSRRRPIWALTEKGKDTVPIIARLIAHSSKWRADELFEDRVPKEIWQIFPKQTIGGDFEIRVT